MTTKDKQSVVEEWEDGNQAIKGEFDRSRPWCGTVFQKFNDDTADALVAMTFGENIEECLARAKLAAAAPRLWAENQALITRLAEPDDAMIEAVARILFDEDEELCGTWDDNIDSVKHYSRQLAKAALTAVANVLGG